MACLLTGLLLVVTALPQEHGPPGGLAYRSYRQALAIVEQSVAVHRPPDGLRDVVVPYTGQDVHHGDWEAPDAVHKTSLRGGLLHSFAWDAVVHEQIVEDGRRQRTTNHYRWGERTVVEVPDDDGPRIEQRDDPQVLDEMRAWMPWDVLAVANERRASLRHLGSEEVAGTPCDVLSFVAADGTARTLYVAVSSRRLLRFDRLLHAGRRGDQVHTVSFDSWRQVDGLLVPGRRVDERPGRTSTTTTTLVFGEVVTNVGLSREVLTPTSDLGAGPPWLGDEPAATPLEVTAIADGLFRITLPEQNCQSLFAVFDEFVVALEAPVDSPTGQRVLDAIHAQVPGLPVRYVTLSHHHRHYCGGLRPFVAAGATIVTTPGNAELVRRFAAWPHTVEPDALTAKPSEPRILLVDRRHVFEDDHRRIELLNLPDTGHTLEYLVTWVPSEKLLFQGDLFSRRSEAPVGPAGAWERGLYDAVMAAGLDVERIVHCWPLRGREREARWEDLAARVDAWREADG